MPSARVVETVTGRTLAELRAARDAADADIVELRTDGVEDLDVHGALAGRRRPVIFTCRAAWEGGAFAGSEAQRLAILGRAIVLGAEFVDVEWKADRRSLPRPVSGQLVLSHHDFTGMPVDLEARVAAMRAEGPDVLKISTAAHRLDDCLRLRRAVDIDLPHVAIAMGNAGQVSRLCPRLFGSLWTYGGTAALGQIAAADLRDVFRIGQQDMHTRLFAVAGIPATADQPAVVLHNVAAAGAGLNAVCVPLETADPGELLAVADVLGIEAIDVAGSLGADLVRVLTDLDDASRRTGAVDSLRRSDGGWQGRRLAPSVDTNVVQRVSAQFAWWTSRPAPEDRLVAVARSRGWVRT